MKTKGQVMILTVLIISGTILGTTTIASVLMLNQIRQSTNVANSLQAIFAADAGLEWELYRNFVDSDYPKPQLERADFITETIEGEELLEFRSVGCAGFARQSLGDGGGQPNQCPRPINRSLQLFFELVL